jgi:hypothetical protein
MKFVGHIAIMMMKMMLTTATTTISTTAHKWKHYFGL